MNQTNPSFFQPIFTTQCLSYLTSVYMEILNYNINLQIRRTKTFSDLIPSNKHNTNIGKTL